MGPMYNVSTGYDAFGNDGKPAVANQQTAPKKFRLFSARPKFRCVGTNDQSTPEEHVVADNGTTTGPMYNVSTGYDAFGNDGKPAVANQQTAPKKFILFSTRPKFRCVGTNDQSTPEEHVADNGATTVVNCTLDPGCFACLIIFLLVFVYDGPNTGLYVLATLLACCCLCSCCVQLSHTDR
jgi:hypothetical protein